MEQSKKIEVPNRETREAFNSFEQAYHRVNRHLQSIAVLMEATEKDLRQMIEEHRKLQREKN